MILVSSVSLVWSPFRNRAFFIPLTMGVLPEIRRFSKVCQYMFDTFSSFYYTFNKHISSRITFLRYSILTMSRKLKDVPYINFDASQIGKRISSFRKDRGYTQKELAEIIGIKLNIWLLLFFPTHRPS